MDDLDWLKHQRDEHASVVLPEHVAIIMDGNGRWAQRYQLSTEDGHNEGAQALCRTVEACISLKLDYLTVYAFSMENWDRHDHEVKMLMRLMGCYLKSERKSLKQHNIRLHVIGELSLLPKELRAEITQTQQELSRCDGMTLTLALSYGARAEITQAVRKIAKRVAEGDLCPEEIQMDHIQNLLGTAGIPDPDLLIRTSGEMRLSNFLLWQMAYTELYFCQVMWPEFDARWLWQALLAFGRRKRRFGQRSASHDLNTTMTPSRSHSKTLVKQHSSRDRTMCFRAIM